jgi:hypothetical protein
MCKFCATTFFPVPLSPVIRTGMPAVAANCTWRRTTAIAWESPRRIGIGTRDGEINCIILRLALFIARTTPNEDIGIPPLTTRPWAPAGAVANQSPAASVKSFANHAYLGQKDC